MSTPPPADVRLADFPLPVHDDQSSKHDRGTVVVVGGSVATPGAALLAGLAALRAGAGRLRVATVPEVAVALGIAVPEALVSSDVPATVRAAQAVLVGPGILDEELAASWLELAIAAVESEGVLVVDAGALPAAAERASALRELGGRVLLTPNPSEVSSALGCDSPDDLPRLAEALGAVVAMRGPETYVAVPGEGGCLVDRSGAVGLATSGSGDVAAGIAAGLAARGASPVTAAVWSAALHGRAGERLTSSVGPVSFLARELLDEIPAALSDLS